MILRPLFASLLTSSIFVSADMLVFSFCSPSRGPTSTIRIWSANARLECVKERVLHAAGREVVLLRRARVAGSDILFGFGTSPSTRASVVSYIDEKVFGQSVGSKGTCIRLTLTLT